MSRTDTHLILRESIQRVGVKKVASALGVSQSLVYKWCQEQPGDSTPEASGVTNPLDRLMVVFELSQDRDLVQYICHRAGGYFTPNIMLEDEHGRRFLSETVQILDKFADLIRYAEQSLHNDGVIDEEEGRQLRRNWDGLKSRLESFIVGCENGLFDLDKEKRPSAKDSE